MRANEVSFFLQKIGFVVKLLHDRVGRFEIVYLDRMCRLASLPRTGSGSRSPGRGRSRRSDTATTGIRPPL